MSGASPVGAVLPVLPECPPRPAKDGVTLGGATSRTRKLIVSTIREAKAEIAPPPGVLAFVDELAALYAELWAAGKLNDLCHDDEDASREDE